MLTSVRYPPCTSTVSRGSCPGSSVKCFCTCTKCTTPTKRKPLKSSGLQFLELQFEGSAPWNAFNPKNSPQKPPFVTWNSYISRGRVKYYGIFSRQTANHGDPASNDLVTMMWHELWSREPWKKNMINIIYATATVILQFLDLSSFSSKESSITLDSCSLVWNRIMWQVLPPKSSQGFGTSPNPGREVNQPVAVHRHLDPTEEPPHRLNGEFSVHLSWGFHCATDGLIEDVTNQVPAAITRTCSTKLVFFVKSTKVVKRQGLLCCFLIKWFCQKVHVIIYGKCEGICGELSHYSLPTVENVDLVHLVSQGNTSRSPWKSTWNPSSFEQVWTLLWRRRSSWITTVLKRHQLYIIHNTSDAKDLQHLQFSS